MAALKRFLAEGARLTQALDLSQLSPQRLKAIQDRAQQVGGEISSDEPGGCRQLLERLVERITLSAGALCIQLRGAGLAETVLAGLSEGGAKTEGHYDLRFPISPRRRGVEAKLLIGDGSASPPDEALVTLLGTAHRRCQKLIGGEVDSIKELARIERVDASDIGRSLRLAFLAPAIIEAILAGRQPLTLTARHLRRIGHLPVEWERQRAYLGFSA